MLFHSTFTLTLKLVTINFYTHNVKHVWKTMKVYKVMK